MDWLMFHFFSFFWKFHSARDSKVLETTLLQLYLVSTGEGRERGIAHFLDQHRRTLWIHSRGFTPFAGKQWEWVSLTLPTWFLGWLAVYLPLHYTAVTVAFSICPKCFGERDRKWIQYLLPRQKSILTRTNAFYIPVQLRADLAFMVLFLMQSMWWVSFAKWHAQE